MGGYILPCTGVPLYVSFYNSCMELHPDIPDMNDLCCFCDHYTCTEMYYTFIYSNTVYREFFASGNFGENDA